MLATWEGREALTAAALRTLVHELGADVEAKEAHGRTLLACWAASSSLSSEALMRLLLDEYGASAAGTDSGGSTPLMLACFSARPYSWAYYGYSALSQAKVGALLRASSPEARRAVRRVDGKSAVDGLITYYTGASSVPPWCRRAISDLLASGAPVLPANAAIAQEIAAMEAGGGGSGPQGG